MSGIFSASFWETDFISHSGFETLSNHLKEGQKSCKWLEDYMKQRAKAEEDYAKSLLKIAKNAVSDFGSLRSTLEKLQSELEVEASLHLTAATKLQEQCTKLTEFRESQKEEKKRLEDVLHRFQRIKTDQYKRLTTCKLSYESRFKAMEKADNDAEKIKFVSKPKEVEKAKSRSLQCRSACLKADEEYKASVNSLEAARANWVREHIVCCNGFQTMEENRICTMRNVVWVFSNIVSDLCCRLDDSREQIRQVAETCSEVDDIQEFTNLKTTGKIPLKTICYQACGPNGAVICPLANFNPDSLTQISPTIPNGSSHNPYEMADTSEIVYTAVYSYKPQDSQEMDLKEGDRIKQIKFQGDGWIEGLNLRTKQMGLVPLNYVTD